MNINQYAVYQLKESAELAAYRSRSYQYLTEHHFQVIVQNYQQAYFTKLFTSDTPEMIRKRLEEHRPKNFRGRPFGVGDVIVIKTNREKSRRILWIRTPLLWLLALSAVVVLAFWLHLTRKIFL